jgi:catecholate siderophore receptor
VPAGSRLANVPKSSFSLWNRYDVSRKVGIGLGVIYRGDVFTASDNTVVLPGYLRADAAAYLGISPRWGAQLNVENVFDRRYYLFANGNNNITPGSPRALRVGLTTRF